MDPAAFRAQFPVFERAAYLNAGTEGPIPACAVEAVRQRLELEASAGRSGRAYFEELMALADRLREAYAGLLGCAAAEVAITGSTTDGVNTVLAGLELRPGEEILTSEEEHPGLLAPLARAQRIHHAKVRVVPFAEIAGEVSSATRLVACSHVSWVGGQVVDAAALAASGVPVLLDAAQALGAVPVDVRALGCDFYAASGQKWLCGPEGSGCLYVRADRLEELTVPWPGYGSLADPLRALEFAPRENAARLDHGFPIALRSTWALASLEVLSDYGWERVHERAASLAQRLADELASRGHDVRPRARSTLVSWACDGDLQEAVDHLAASGLVIRGIPAFGLLRASVGAWNSEEDLERLVSAVSA